MSRRKKELDRAKVRESAEGLRPRRTPEERADAARVRAERAEFRRRNLAAIRATDPACETADDPPVQWRVPRRIGATPNGVMLALDRLSGSGQPGSRLLVAAREYDGAGPNGGEPDKYAALYTIFQGAGGYQWRSVGTRVRHCELRAVAAALSALADEYDVFEDKGGALPPKRETAA